MSNSPAYPFLNFIEQFQVGTSGTIAKLTTVFHAWVYGTFIEMKSNLRRKKFHRTNQAPIFMEVLLEKEVM